MKNQLRKSVLTICPELKPLRADLLCKVVGPILLGIELPTHPRSGLVVPQFVIYPLWLPKVTDCLKSNVLNKHFLDTKGVQLEINKEAPNESSFSASKERLGINFEGDVSKQKIVQLIDKTRFEPPLSAAPSSYKQARTLEYMLTIESLYDPQSATLLLEKMLLKDWDPIHFGMCNADVEDWKHAMVQLVRNTEGINNIISANKNDAKVATLVTSNLV